MESIDALARCLNKFKGGVLMISHDIRLIRYVAESAWVIWSSFSPTELISTCSQCAEQIYICDNKQITLYKGDIMDFKLHTKKENNKKLAQHMNG